MQTTGMIGLALGKIRRDWLIVLPDAGKSAMAFQAFISDHGTVTPFDGVLRATPVFSIDGKMDWPTHDENSIYSNKYAYRAQYLSKAMTRTVTQTAMKIKSQYAFIDILLRQLATRVPRPVAALWERTRGVEVDTSTIWDAKG